MISPIPIRGVIGAERAPDAQAADGEFAVALTGALDPAPQPPVVPGPATSAVDGTLVEETLAEGAGAADVEADAEVVGDDPVASSPHGGGETPRRFMARPAPPMVDGSDPASGAHRSPHDLAAQGMHHREDLGAQLPAMVDTPTPPEVPSEPGREKLTLEVPVAQVPRKQPGFPVPVGPDVEHHFLRPGRRVGLGGEHPVAGPEGPGEVLVPPGRELPEGGSPIPGRRIGLPIPEGERTNLPTPPPPQVPAPIAPPSAAMPVAPTNPVSIPVIAPAPEVAVAPTPADVMPSPENDPSTVEAGETEGASMLDHGADAASGLRGPERAAGTPPASLDTAGQSRAARLAERIERWVSQAEHRPPPNTMIVRPEGPEGLAIRVALEGGALFLSVDGAGLDDIAWLREVADRLQGRGLDLDGFDLSGSSDEARSRWDDEAPERRPRRRRPRRPDGLRL